MHNKTQKHEELRSSKPRLQKPKHLSKAKFMTKTTLMTKNIDQNNQERWKTTKKFMGKGDGSYHRKVQLSNSNGTTKKKMEMKKLTERQERIKASWSCSTRSTLV